MGFRGRAGGVKRGSNAFTLRRWPNNPSNIRQLAPEPRGKGCRKHCPAEGGHHLNRSDRCGSPVARVSPTPPGAGRPYHRGVELPASWAGGSAPAKAGISGKGKPMDDETFVVRAPKRWARIAMTVGVTALIVAPLTEVATNSFTDVPASNTFHKRHRMAETVRCDQRMQSARQHRVLPRRLCHSGADVGVHTPPRPIHGRRRRHTQ